MEANEVTAKYVDFWNKEKTNKHIFINNTIMPPKVTFSSIIKTCPKNKDVHPSNVVNHNDDGNPKSKCQTPEEIKEVHYQWEVAQKTTEQNSQNAIHNCCCGFD